MNSRSGRGTYKSWLCYFQVSDAMRRNVKVLVLLQIREKSTLPRFGYTNPRRYLRNVAQIYIIKQESEVFNCFKSYYNYLVHFTKNQVLEVRSDNGREYLNQNFYDFALEKGFRINPGVPYTCMMS